MENKKTQTSKINVMLNNVKIQFPHLDKPFSLDPSEPAKYSAAITIDADDKENKNKLYDAMVRAGMTCWDEETTKRIIKEKNQVKDGTERFKYNCVYINLKSKFAPQVFDQKRRRLSEDEIAARIHGGATVNVLIQLSALNTQFNKCITKYITAVQLVKESEWKNMGSDNDLSGLFTDVEYDAPNFNDPF